MVSAREIQAVAELLQVSPEGLQKAITFKVTVSLRILHPDEGLFFWCLSSLSCSLSPLSQTGEVEPHFRPPHGLFPALILFLFQSCQCG